MYNAKELFMNPGLHELCDWATVGKQGYLIEENKGAPCFYQMCGHATEGVTRVYVGLRMPRLAMGMDLEDDINRDARMNGSTEYAWKFEHGKKGKHYKPSDDAYAIDYWKYLFNARYSPWRQALRVGHEFYYNGKDIIGVHVDVDDKTDAQIIMSLFMAARIPWECLGHLRVYGQLRDNGFLRSESLYVMTHIRQLKDGGYDFRTAHGHFPFSPQDTDIAYSWLRKGTPHTKGLRFNDGTNYGNVDHIWDRQKRDAHKFYMPRNDRSLADNTLYRILGKDKDYGGQFIKAYKKTNPHGKLIGSGLGTFDEIITTLRDRRKEWAF